MEEVKNKEYYTITIMQRPIAKSNMYKTRVVMSKDKKRAKAIIYTTRELEDYEMMIGQLANEAIPKTINTYASMYMRIYQKGKSWIDIDNTFKAIQDSLDVTKKITRGKKEFQVCETGISNDKLFQLIIGERIHVDTAEEQRIELIIEEYKGLFHLANLVKEHYKLEDNYYEDLFLPKLQEEK